MIITRQNQVVTDEIVGKLFEDLRDRRMLKWLFAERPTLIGRFEGGEELRSLDADVQDEIRADWAKIIGAALSFGGVRVKPLEWGKTSYGMPEAFSVAGTYRITEAWDGGFNVSRGKVSLQGEDGRRNFPTLEAAKAAAQADFDRLILSVIEPAKAVLSADAGGAKS